MRKSDWGAVPRIAPVLVGALLLFSRGVIAQDRQPGISPDDSAPSGLVVVIENRPDRSLNLQVLDNPCISGVALQIHWADIESTEGNPDWTKLDRLFAAAESSKKWVHLMIFPGFFSPGWALEGVKTELFALQYGPGKGTVERLPMPWNKVYLNRWFAFLKHLSDRYGKSPAFMLVAADGPTTVSAEFTLPKRPDDLKKWQHDFYRPSKYIGAWKEVFQAYADGFPKQFISLSAGSGQININEQDKLDPREHLQTRKAIVDEAIATLGRRFVLQMSDVHAGPGPHSVDSQKEDKFLIGFNGRIITGFQLRTSAERNSGVMGAEGDPPKALKKSINLALQPNEAGKHVNYVEIYEPDVVADDMQSELRYAASVFARPEKPNDD